MGQVLSELARKALETKPAPRMRNGVPLFVPKPGAKKPHLALPKPRAAKRPLGLAQGKFKVPKQFFDPLPSEVLEAFV